MNHNEKVIVCGGKEYPPKLEKVANTSRLTFKVLATRGGNTQKNYDVFEIKCFGKLAEQYYEQLKNDGLKGHTVWVQLSLEVNDKTNNIEIICTYMRTEIGEEILLPNCPNYAQKKPPDNEVSKVEIAPKETSRETNETKQLEETSINPQEIPSSKETTYSEKVVIEESVSSMEEKDSFLHQAPIGVIGAAKVLFKNAKYSKIKQSTTGDLAENDDYLVFRDLMG